MSTEHQHFRPKSHIIGLTGGIASGKSTVSSFFAKRGVHIIDADINAREVVKKGSLGLKEISALFGKEVLTLEGNLNREQLGTIIFADPLARIALNQIIHPLIAARFQVEVERLTSLGVSWLIYDAALIVENNLHEAFDALIVVSCQLEVQRQRLMNRNKLTLDEADSRIASQFPLSKKVEVADWVIDNSESLAKTETQVSTLYSNLVERFGSPHRKEV